MMSFDIAIDIKSFRFHIPHNYFAANVGIHHLEISECTQKSVSSENVKLDTSMNGKPH